MTKAEYEKYLQSATWQGKRKAALKRADYRCQLCNHDAELHVHHRTYERVGGKELAMDLTVLCRPCHEHFHGIDGGKKRPLKHTKKQGTKRQRAGGKKPCTGCGKVWTTKGTCRPCKRRGKLARRATSLGVKPTAIPKESPPRPATRKDLEVLVRLLQEERKTSREKLAAESGSEVAA